MVLRLTKELIYFGLTIAERNKRSSFFLAYLQGREKKRVFLFFPAVDGAMPRIVEVIKCRFAIEHYLETFHRSIPIINISVLLKG